LEGLGINWQGLVVQIVNVAILLYLLRRFAYKPFLGILDRRAEKIRESVTRAEEIQQQAEATEQEFASRIQEARRQGQEIVNQANQAAERIRADAEQRARGAAEEFLSRARGEITQERERALSELRRQTADLAILAATQVVRESLDTDAHRRIVERVLAESSDPKLN
jgi:F-type H+-transporting ATPase subunit b